MPKKRLNIFAREKTLGSAQKDLAKTKAKAAQSTQRKRKTLHHNENPARIEDPEHNTSAEEIAYESGKERGSRKVARQANGKQTVGSMQNAEQASSGSKEAGNVFKVSFVDGHLLCRKSFLTLPSKP